MLGINVINDECGWVRLIVTDDGNVIHDEWMPIDVDLNVQMRDGDWSVARKILDEGGNYVMPLDHDGMHATGFEYLDVCDWHDTVECVWRTEYEHEYAEYEPECEYVTAYKVNDSEEGDEPEAYEY